MGTYSQDQEELCLRWKDFESQTLSAFRNLRNDAEFCDIRLAVKGEAKTLKAHRVVLSACSPYFHDLLKEMNSEQSGMMASPSYIMMSGVKRDYLSAILDFMYVGEAKVAEEDLGPFLKLAEELQVKGLVSKNESKSDSCGTPIKRHAPPLAAQPCLSNPNLSPASKRARISVPPTPNTHKAPRKQIKMEALGVTNDEIYSTLEQNRRKIEESCGTVEEGFEDQDDQREDSRVGDSGSSHVHDGHVSEKEKQEGEHFFNQHLTQADLVCEICNKVYKNKKSKDSHLYHTHKILKSTRSHKNFGTESQQ